MVTGATGFIGQRLVERLVARGDDVACVVRSSSQTVALERLGVRLVRAPLEEATGLLQAYRAAFDGNPVEVVHHLAGRVHGRTLAEFLAVNERGTAAVCEAATALPTPPVVIVVSSLAAVGPSAPGMPHDETTTCRPISLYGQSKLAAERAARRWAGKAPISIVRPPLVFGPGDRDGLMLFKAIRALGIHFVPQLQGLPLSLIYADDLVAALLAVAERGERCRDSVAADPQSAPNDSRGVYFAADPVDSSYAQIGRMAAAALERRVWVLCRRKYPLLPAALAGDFYGWFTGKPVVLGSDKLREASASGWLCRSEKIVSMLGWAPAAPAAQRYRETAQWYREAGWL
ncbi:dTDP-4-oxo-6-deoxy-D-allose reductase [Botrimarina hoheduenensis]|uniref:dTDP-4-oxo-6-deoxy-D-allose reductase n=1 Tax=Botrimarina hoheduenensis TaxID=2528000 RepID=A0A5C5WDX4_9BACT|nr:dTDP-4-oxo-6-deoxy-D-allose reductase [Botrimarina hoheduenensis]